MKRGVSFVFRMKGSLLVGVNSRHVSQTLGLPQEKLDLVPKGEMQSGLIRFDNFDETKLFEYSLGTVMDAYSDQFKEIPKVFVGTKDVTGAFLAAVHGGVRF